GRMFATVDTGLNLIHVADVARGHLLAARLGGVGEKYILGCENHSLAEIFGLLERITGIRAPRLRVPHALVTLVALGNEALSRATGRPPAGPAHGRPDGAQANVLQRRQGGAGAHPAPDPGRAGAARRGGLVRRSRLRAPAPRLPTTRRLRA